MHMCLPVYAHTCRGLRLVSGVSPSLSLSPAFVYLLIHYLLRCGFTEPGAYHFSRPTGQRSPPSLLVHRFVVHACRQDHVYTGAGYGLQSCLRSWCCAASTFHAEPSPAHLPFLEALKLGGGVFSRFCMVCLWKCQGWCRRIWIMKGKQNFV